MRVPPGGERWVGRAGRLALVGACAPIFLMLIGGQMAYRLRDRYDRRQGEMLRALVPQPPEGAVFIPASIAIHPERARQARHYQYLAPVWSVPWASPNFVRLLYRRRDLTAGSNWGARLVAANAAGVLYGGDLWSPFYAREPGGTRVPWGKAVLFAIDRSGDLALITTVRVTGGGGAEYVLPLATEAVAAGAPTRVLELPPG